MSTRTKAFTTFASLVSVAGLGVTLAGPAAAATGTPVITASCAGGVTASITGSTVAVGADASIEGSDIGGVGGGTNTGNYSVNVPAPQDTMQHAWAAHIYTFGKATNNGVIGGSEMTIVKSAKGTIGPCLVKPTASGDGKSAASPIVVSNPREVPADAIQDPISTFSTGNKCDSTRSWVLTQAAVEEASHQEFRFKQVIPGSAAVTHEELRYKQEVPAVSEVSHTEYGIQERTRDFKPGHDEVSHTEYGIQERTREFKPGTPGSPAVIKHHDAVEEVRSPDVWQNFSPNKGQGPLRGAPSWPSDSRGTWQHKGKSIPPGQAGPDGVYQHGNGNASWFYREAGKVITPAVPAYDEVITPAVPATPDSYSDWSAWDTTASGLKSEPVLKSNTNTHEYRQLTPVKVVDSPAVPDAYSNWTDWATTASGLKSKPVLKSNTNTHEFRQLAEVTVVDQEAVAGYTEYYVAPGTALSRNEADAGYTASNPDPEAFTPFGDVKVVTDKEAVPAKTVYYVQGGEPSANETDASWVKASPGEVWTQFDERKVIDVVATPEKKTFYGYSNNVACNTTTYIDTTPPVIPAPPVVKPPVVKPPVVKPPVVKPPVVVAPVIVVKPLAVKVPVKTVLIKKDEGQAVGAIGYGAPHTGGAGDRLPTTGDNTGIIAAMGVALLAVGGVLRFGSRRRRADQS